MNQVFIDLTHHPDRLPMSIEMSEKRVAPRKRTLLEGHIEFAGGAAIDCTVRNLSSSGARLRVVSVIGIPDEFVLSYGTDAERKPARVAWRKATELGVAFTEG